MNNSSDAIPRRVMFIFFIQMLLNWLYCAWIDDLPGIIINSWFVVMPLIGYFYFTFALIALIGLYQRKQFGVTLAYGVLLVGAMLAVISYNVIYKRFYLLEQLVIPLLAANLFVIFYIMRYQTYFKGK